MAWEVRGVAWVWLLAAVHGCYLSHERDASAPEDLGVADAGDAGDAPCIPTTTEPRPVDVLFVVDDSPSMVEEQAQLARQLPRFLGGLVTGDGDGDGRRDFVPVDDLHVGVITVNMGVAGLTGIPTCARNADFGDDGVLLTVPRVPGDGCRASYPRFLAFHTGDSAAQLSTDLACLARTGASGCGFEQQLDATLKALLPASSPTGFWAGTHGHGDDPGTNGGFLRAGSVVAVLTITDEDDCSTDVVDVWNPTSTSHVGDLNLRCIDYASELYPVSRFVDGLRSLRPGAPDDVVYLAITGVPEDLVAGATVDYARLFADPRMQNTVLPGAGGTLTLQPACSAAGRGIAAPAIRLARVAQGLGSSGLVQSICAERFDFALSWLAGRAGVRASCTR